MLMSWKNLASTIKMVNKMTTIFDTFLSNTYGGVKLQINGGEYFVRLDCMAGGGADIGPLSTEQVAAFFVLFLEDGEFSVRKNQSLTSERLANGSSHEYFSPFRDMAISGNHATTVSSSNNSWVSRVLDCQAVRFVKIFVLEKRLRRLKLNARSEDSTRVSRERIICEQALIEARKPREITLSIEIIKLLIACAGATALVQYGVYFR